MGMSHGGNKCREYWDEFIHDRERLLFESETILAQYEGTNVEQKYDRILKDISSTVGDSKIGQVKIRVNQNVFRQIVLANYDGKCASTGIDIPELLVASHIIPWSENKNERLNPRNGICLSSLYDKAFDQGFVSFNDENKVIFSARLQANMGKDYYENFFIPIKEKSLATTRKYDINPAFLEWHRNCVFNK